MARGRPGGRPCRRLRGRRPERACAAVRPAVVHARDGDDRRRARGRGPPGRPARSGGDRRSRAGAGGRRPRSPGRCGRAGGEHHGQRVRHRGSAGRWRQPRAGRSPSGRHAARHRPGRAQGGRRVPRWPAGGRRGDGRPLSVPVRGAAVPAVSTWVRVRGRLAAEGNRLVVQADRVERIGTPSRPLL